MQPEVFEEIIKKGYSLDILYILELVDEKIDVSEMCKGSVKIAALYQSTIRKGLLSDEGNLTIAGKELLTFSKSKFVEKLKKYKNDEDAFIRWWKTFPGTDTFEYKGRRFAGSRTLRVNKEECRIKFNKILLEGEYTEEQLIKALIYDVIQKKENSIRTNDNKLRYLQNSNTYLNQRSFEAYMELINTTIIETPEIVGGTDI